MEENKIIKREIFLEELPRWENGKNKGNISWFNTIIMLDLFMMILKEI